MTDRLRMFVRGVLALMLAFLAWGVSHNYAFLTGQEALLVAGLLAFAVMCPTRTGAWRITAALALVVTLVGFWYILHDRLASRNLVLVGLLVALTGLLTTRRGA